jgi:hypothetical protein
MFQKLFTSLYEALLGLPEPALLTQAFENSIFPGVGLATLFGIGLLGALFFYLVLNRLLTTPYYQTKHWLVMLLLLAILAGVLGWFQARSVVYEVLDAKGIVIPAGSTSAYSRYVLGFAFVNALFGALFFVLWSFLTKGLSPNAKVTPVRWPN